MTVPAQEIENYYRTTSSSMTPDRCAPATSSSRPAADDAAVKKQVEDTLANQGRSRFRGARAALRDESNAPKGAIPGSTAATRW